MNNWLLFPIALLLTSGLIFIGNSKEALRLNRHLDHLKYTDFVALWWVEGNMAKFLCAPDDAEKIMLEKRIQVKPKQAIYVTFLLPIEKLLHSDTPVQDVEDKMYQELAELKNIHLSELSWDELYAKAYHRHYSFRLSAEVYWSSLVFAILGSVVLAFWSKRKLLFGGAFICLAGLIFTGWWYLNPPPSLYVPDSKIVWFWSQKLC